MLRGKGKPLHPRLVQRGQHRRFQPAEAEIVGIRLEPGPGQLHRPFRRQGEPVQVGAAGIRQPQGPGHLVVGLAHGVVPGPPDNAELARPLQHHQLRVSAGHHQCQAGILQLLDEAVGIDMTGNMVHRNQRQS
ncbi:hypothetical protein D3C76_1336670 [compost metagenome]